MKTNASLMFALLVAIANSACGVSQAATSVKRSPPAWGVPLAPADLSRSASALHQESDSTTLPAEVIGVWSRDDVAGRAKCSRYRTLQANAGESDAGSISMIGSMVITPRMIHEYSEYGEGNFNAVKEVAPLGGGAWAVKVQVGIDTVPADEDQTEVETYRLELQQGRLGWGPQNPPGDRAERYFRCGDIRPDIYRVE